MTFKIVAISAWGFLGAAVFTKAMVYFYWRGFAAGYKNCHENAIRYPELFKKESVDSVG